MWSFPNTISNLRLRKVATEPNLCCTDLSDDDAASSSSREEGLECPICWESFNIVENVPYVLWCGHSLCQNCVLALQWAVLTLPAQKFKLPFFVSCPWCNLLSLRWVYRGQLKFPRKNYFILWMIESLNGERSKSSFPVRGDSQSLFSPRISSLTWGSASNFTSRRAQHTHSQGRLITNNDESHASGYNNVDRSQFSLHKSLDYFIHFAAKFPLVIIFLVIIFLVIPGSFSILVLYCLVSVLLALPSCLILYFAYPTLEWLLREISS
ncbi:hypothetical protein vseg_019891 [Gypsophila vaccaria]